MSEIGPIKRRDLIRYVKSVWSRWPVPGMKHRVSRWGGVTLRLPNPY